MTFRDCCLFASLIVLASCGPRQEPQKAANNSTAPVLPAPSAPPEVTNTAAPVPENQASLPEPKGPIDPASPEAAAQVVQHFGALIEQKRWGETESLWGDATAAKKMTAQMKSNSVTHLEVGKPTDMEGAAGSSFITVTIVAYGKDAKGAAFHRSSNVILRRVNDVPGSTEAQRHWHIDRIDGADAG